LWSLFTLFQCGGGFFWPLSLVSKIPFLPLQEAAFGDEFDENETQLELRCSSFDQSTETPRSQILIIFVLAAATS